MVLRLSSVAIDRDRDRCSRDIRRVHVAALHGHFAELASDLRVVNGRRDHAWIGVSCVHDHPYVRTHC